MIKSFKIALLMVVLIAILALLLVLKILFSPTTKSQPVPFPTFSASPAENFTTSNQVASEEAKYFSSDYERITNKKKLNRDNLSIRKKLIQSLGNKSGKLEETDGYLIQYFKSPDYFLVEIKNNDTKKAMNEVTGWFEAQGLDAEGVCNLPVVFYLSPEIHDYFQQNNMPFNPEPEGC